ncbi:molecular chaperone DnaJ [Acinetobacter lwoffii]|uniref:molecular chaperone DnaJ n=1 Tax=Acinetobacter lwoffii TaxID=28090 RepID=UPI00209AC6D3|nr:molecular chaperone DnaJ [Acinetobacter lwoffii]MCO8073402.1 molecular chaperone DnaJ [Acinetobacter lwoffii]MCO8076379.1 molecular chaperone DnaJ [Acinetobacter lwoffii]
MLFDLKTMIQPFTALSPQQKKLDHLIDKIEQQKQELEQWQQAEEDLQQYTHKTFMPVYHELHGVLFKQLEQLWKHLQETTFSKVELVVLDEKIQYLANYLKDSQAMSVQQAHKVNEIFTYYQQRAEHAQFRKSQKKINELETFFKSENGSDLADVEVFEVWESDHFQQVREQAKLKRQQEKQEQAAAMAEQSLKTVYLKIAAIIHPDREVNDVKKIKKTELLQRANEAYAEQDLFTLLRMQLQIEQDQDVSKKGLSAEQLKFYQLALDAQSRKLQDQIDALINRLVWSSKTRIAVKKAKGKVQIADLYKQIDEDTLAIKQQIKVEKERLMYIKKVSGLEMFLRHGML